MGGPHSGEGGDGILRPSYTRVDDRGTLREVLNAGRWESLLCGEMRPGAVMGHHFHKVTEVFVYLTSGRIHVTEVEVTTGVIRSRQLAAGEGIWLHPNVAHALRFEEASSFLMLKSKQYQPDDPDTFHYSVPL